MDELEAIRQRKLQELQQNYNQQVQDNADEEAATRQQIAQLEAAVKQRMTKEALQRYSNIKAVDQEKSLQLLVAMAQLLQSGRIKTIDEESFKRITMMVTPKKKETKIIRR